MNELEHELNKAIETFEQRAAALKAKFDAEYQGLQEGIAMLRNQQTAKPARRKKVATTQQP